MTLKPKNFFSLLYVAFFAVIIVLSTGYNAKARLIPLVVAIPCLLFSVAQLIFDLLGKEKKKGRSIGMTFSTGSWTRSTWRSRVPARSPRRSASGT